MPNPQIGPGQSVVIGINGLAADKTTVLPFSSCTATISDYTSAFVAMIPPPSGIGEYAMNVVFKSQPEGQTTTVTVTAHAKNAVGADLPPVTQDVDVVGAALPPQAESIALNVGLPGSFYFSTTPDPGSPTATIV